MLVHRFHPGPAEQWQGVERRASRERLVREGRAHAMLVIDGDYRGGVVPVRRA